MPVWITNLEGLSLLTAGVILLLTIYRKGRESLLETLAWFFIAGGLFRLGMALAGIVGGLEILAGLAPLTTVITNACLYAGVAGYLSQQLRFLRGAAAGRVALVIGLAVAAGLTVVHVAATGMLPLPAAAIAAFASRQLMVMVLFLGAAFLAMVLTMGLGAANLRSAGVPVTGTTTAHLGLAFLLVSWMLQKLVQASPGSLAGIALSALPFLALGIVVVATVLQTSTAMAPGVVLDGIARRPVALAIVRVFRSEDQKLLETRVTGPDGRYGILLGPGTYHVTVTAEGYRFPSTQPGGYHGDPVDVRRPMLLGYEISVDSVASAPLAIPAAPVMPKPPPLAPTPV